MSTRFQLSRWLQHTVAPWYAHPSHIRHILLTRFPPVRNIAHHPRRSQGLLQCPHIVLIYPSTQIEIFCEAVPKTAQVYFHPSLSLSNVLPLLEELSRSLCIKLLRWLPIS